jgi:hypothetical protein
MSGFGRRRGSGMTATTTCGRQVGWLLVGTRALEKTARLRL